jgi:hypothetical protein
VVYVVVKARQGAARGLSNDADRDQLPQQAEGRLRRDRQAC